MLPAHEFVQILQGMSVPCEELLAVCSELLLPINANKENAGSRQLLEEDLLALVPCMMQMLADVMSGRHAVASTAAGAAETASQQAKCARLKARRGVITALSAACASCVLPAALTRAATASIVAWLLASRARDGA